MSMITPPIGTPIRLLVCSAIGYKSPRPFTVIVVEQLAIKPFVSVTDALTRWAPTAKAAVKSTRAVVGGPPAATALVWRAAPSTAHTTTSGPPSASATFTETVATAPLGDAQFNVIGPGQLMVGAWFSSSRVTTVEQVATQALASVTEAVTWWAPTANSVVKSTRALVPGKPGLAAMTLV